MCLLCVHFCMYKAFLLDFYSVHLLNKTTYLQLGWSREEWGMQALLLRRDDVIKNKLISRKNLHVYLFYSISQNQCLVVSLTLPERTFLKFCCLSFTHPAVGCQALGMLGFDSCAEAGGKCQDRRISLWGCNILQLCCHLLCGGECFHTFLIPLWFLSLLPGRSRLCNQHSSLVSWGAVKCSKCCPSSDWIHVLAWCTVYTTSTWSHSIVQWQKQEKKVWWQEGILKSTVTTNQNVWDSSFQPVSLCGANFLDSMGNE